MSFEPFVAVAATGGTGGTVLMVVYIAVIIGAMYFLLIRPQRKKNKEEKELRESIQVGDEIISIGGIYGRIISLKEDTVVIESKSDHSKLTLARWAIHSNLTPHAKAGKDGKSVSVKENK